jgi:hypothetical protein
MYGKMMEELVRWFWQKYGFRYSGIDCMAIRRANGTEKQHQRCWQILEDVYFKVNDILVSNGIAISFKGCYAR